MFGRFTEDAQKILVTAKKEMLSLKHPYVGSEHLLLAILKSSDFDISKKLFNHGITYRKFKDALINKIGIGKEKSTWFLYTPLLKRVIENAIINSKEDNSGEVSVEHLFIGLLEEGEGVAIRILLSIGVNLDAVYKDVCGGIKRSGNIKKKAKMLVEDFGVDLNRLALDKKVDPVIGREKELGRIIEILSRRTKNNPILIGDAGVGKTALIEELSSRIVNDKVPNFLKGKRIIALDIASLVAGTKYRGEFEERIKNILKELEESDDIILFIDEMHTLMGAGGAEGAIDASNILKPALARNKMKCIGATTTAEFKKYIENDSAFERRFQKVIIEEPNKVELREILLRLKPIYESFHNVLIPDYIIDKSIELSGKYLYDRKEPDKTIDLIDEVAAKVSLKESKGDKRLEKLRSELNKIDEQKNQAIINQDFNYASELKEQEIKVLDKINKMEIKKLNEQPKNEVTVNDLIKVIQIKTKIPVYELDNNNISILTKIEKEFKAKIIGQEEPINKVMDIIKRIKLGFKDEGRPYSFIFVGPTGVGKTKLANLLGDKIVGPTNIIKLDMSEFAESYSISKIMGAAPGYVGYMDNRNILEEVRNKPHSIIILDEIEKGHPSVINLFLQILDEGRIKDSSGNIIRFDNSIIIMTSNLGFNKSMVGFNNDKNKVMNVLKETLSIEFVNRIDSIIVFNRLEESAIKEIIKNNIKLLRNKLRDKNIIIRLGKKVVDTILINSRYEEFGARRIEKIIKEKLETLIIDSMVVGKKIIKIDEIEPDKVFAD
ncbi:MAG: ATP-dependent Clp protease ATP-binding subunit [Bacilli bacterium]|nr:ATP-dependent Clp protease ATP-binding subunit [Bacilli bacterium]